MTAQGHAHQTNETRMQQLDIGGTKVEMSEINIEEDMKCTGQELFIALSR